MTTPSFSQRAQIGAHMRAGLTWPHSWRPCCDAALAHPARTTARHTSPTTRPARSRSSRTRGQISRFSACPTTRCEVRASVRREGAAASPRPRSRWT